MIEHAPVRPSWDCAACGKPWPCGPAREHLIRSMSRTPLLVYAWSQFEEAAKDMPDAKVGELHERFVTWAH